MQLLHRRKTARVPEGMSIKGLAKPWEAEVGTGKTDLWVLLLSEMLHMLCLSSLGHVTVVFA